MGRAGGVLGVAPALDPTASLADALPGHPRSAVTLFLPFAFRVEGWQFTLRTLRGPRQHVEMG